MEKIKYPLLTFQLQDQAVLGILVGTAGKYMAQDTESLKSQVQDHLRREFRKHGIYPGLRLSKPRLKIMKISYRPSFRGQGSTFPLPYNLTVPIPIVYGKTPYTFFECYLPLFNDYFPYYHENHLDPLSKHLANSYLNTFDPDKIFRLISYGKPKLEYITLRVKTRNDHYWNPTFQREYPELARLADRYPLPKAEKRRMSQGPDAAWEREVEVEDIIEKALRNRNNVLVIGNPGTGKSAILQQAIRKMTSRSKSWSNALTFWRIMPQRITAGAKYLGEWEKAVESMISELQSANGILWVVSLIRLLETGGSGPEDSLAAFIRPFLEQNKLQIIAEATPQELESMRRLLPGFVDTFQLVRVEELSQAQLQRIFELYADYTRKNLRIQMEPEALTTAWQLLQRYYPYESFPGKAIKFFSQCINKAQLEKHSVIDKNAVIANFIEQTGLPELFLRDEQPLDQAELRQFFLQRVIGQAPAVDQLVQLVKIFKAGLSNPDRPISTLLFAGPTGVGKTASAKALADYFFGKGQKQTPLVRIDMSEFQHPTQISRLIGSGRETGSLVRDIRERPFSVLLLDEIEKAHSSIFDALMTLLDEGVMVDAFGRVTNFRNTIVIMTSNLGASAGTPVGYTQTTRREDNYQSAIRRHFRPEFVNRIDGIVVFNQLSQNDIRKITIKELQDAQQREGFTKTGIALYFEDSLIDHLTATGFDPRYGARPLQRAIDQLVVNPIANWLLDNNSPQNCILHIGFTDQLTIKLVRK